MTDIHAVMAALQRAAALSPDERVGQLLFNALDQRGLARHEDNTPRDIFYVTDDQLLLGLRDYAWYLERTRLVPKSGASHAD